MKGQIKYERQLQNTYMTVDTVEEAMVESYGGQIVLRNNFQGFSECKVIKIDGKNLIQYDISNCQDITTVYSVKKMNYEDLTAIIVYLDQIIHEMEGYLMDGLQLVLSPEYVYLDMETKRLKFIFDFSEIRHHSDIVKLGEFFIDRVDHDNEAATELAYYFFEASQNGNYNVERMEEYLEENEKKSKKAKEEKANCNDGISYSRETNYQDDESKDNIDDTLSRDDVLDYLYGDGEYTLSPEKEKLSLFDKIKSFFEDKKSNNKKLKEKNKKVSKYEYYQETAYLPKEDKQDKELGHTVYIGKSARDRDYVLIEMRRSKEITHSIDTYPFTIGSQKDSVNLYIKDSSVSRIHARITKNEDAIYIEDIHSTNGTMINDLPLLPHEKNRIKRGDIITLGKTEFEFR